MPTAYTTAGEFSETALIIEATPAAAVTKGLVCVISPAAAPTAAITGATDASQNGKYGVAIAAIAAAATGRFVIYGEVGVEASGNCYTGQVVYSIDGKALPRSRTDSGYDFDACQALGTVTAGATSGNICTVFVGLVV